MAVEPAAGVARRTRSNGPRLSIHMFGPFRVAIGDVFVSDRLTAKAGALLKIIAAHRRRAIPRDALIERLWPEADPGSGSISLKVAAYTLRRALDSNKEHARPGAWVVASCGSYQLNPSANIWIDVEAFEERQARGRALEARGAWREVQTEYQRAENLYVGDYLEEDLYEEWTIIRREELRDMYLALLWKLGNLTYQQKAYEEAIRYCHKIVLADPCREDAYQMLMRSHVALNQFSRAGAWYAVCRQMLKREVDAKPSDETIRLFESLFS